MQPFPISFTCLGRAHHAEVHKIARHNIQYIVYDIYPPIYNLPLQIVFLSDPGSDQLICQCFEVKQIEVIKMIGEAIFTACTLQKMPVHY